MNDLKLIKKYYGEEMMHFCRDNFATLLETEGLLFRTISSNFAYSKLLWKDLCIYDNKNEFKNYIYAKADIEREVDHKKKVTKTPYELLREVGYTLYECKSEKDIQSFRHFYKRKDKIVPTYEEGETPKYYNGEELCTFNGNRLDGYYVFFAVKDGAENLNRRDFNGKEERQDEYGTSVISIQFSRGRKNNILSIKNRYNHTVLHPDSTFGNNLDNIIPDLTAAFEQEYGLHITNSDPRHIWFSLPDYKVANDGKWYKYNYEIGNVYYCPNNTIIVNDEVIEFEKEKFVVFDYFILDLVKKELILGPEKYDGRSKMYYRDSFAKTIPDIKSIRIIKNHDNTKTIYINDDVEIVINEENEMIKYKNTSVTKIESEFLRFQTKLREIELPNVEKVDYSFMSSNPSIEKVCMPNLIIAEHGFLSPYASIEEIDLPKLEYVGNGFLEWASDLKRINLPNVKEFGDACLTEYNLDYISLPNVEKVGRNFLIDAGNLKKIDMPKLRTISDGFLNGVDLSIKVINLPSVTSIFDNFMTHAVNLEEINIPKICYVGMNFLGEKSERPVLKKVVLSKSIECMSYYDNIPEDIKELAKQEEKKVVK